MSGVLTGYLSWRWCMYVNVVTAAAAMFGAVLYLSEMRPATRPHVDVMGTVLAGVGLFGIMFGLSQAETDGWGSAVTITALVVGAVLLVGFLGVETRVEHPLLPLRVVAKRAPGTAFAAVGIAGLAGRPRGDWACGGRGGLDARMYRDNADILANAR